MAQPILCQTPTRGCLNLAYARQIQFRQIHIHQSWQLACYIIWSNGDSNNFLGKDAQAIAEKLEKMKQKQEV
ncbi:MAG: hypothetical protein C6Y22_01195 [Hapalosiphonaceae cyanobacterium JJU2]|nr:MAG: hypothetical protein C6Y22_01195 [Hapalosiphonaceae cyanobacterium JJU2]